METKVIEKLLIRQVKCTKPPLHCKKIQCLFTWTASRAAVRHRTLSPCSGDGSRPYVLILAPSQNKHTESLSPASRYRRLLKACVWLHEKLSHGESEIVYDGRVRTVCAVRSSLAARCQSAAVGEVRCQVHSGVPLLQCEGVYVRTHSAQRGEKCCRFRIYWEKVM